MGKTIGVILFFVSILIGTSLSISSAKRAVKEKVHLTAKQPETRNEAPGEDQMEVLQELKKNEVELKQLSVNCNLTLDIMDKDSLTFKTKQEKCRKLEMLLDILETMP